MNRQLAFLGLMLIAAIGCSRARASTSALGHVPFPAVPAPRTAKPSTPSYRTLTPELRAKGFSECDPSDPLGYGPYGPRHTLPIGYVLIPQKGGHTPDMGYDVLIHFHGADAVRKLLVQTARGLVLVLVDKGTGGGGPYTRALGSKEAFPLLLRSVEKELRRQSGDDRAHIRHLAVSAWSAGTEALRKLLGQEQPGIDAVIMLDGLHGAWKEKAPRVQDPDSLDARFIRQEIELADRARQGKTLFVLSYSSVDPVTFPSTSATAHLLLRELGLREQTLDPGEAPFAQTSSVDVGGLHVWGFEGKDQKGHCAQLWQMPRIVSEIIEPAFGTPPMDRSVPPTPKPW